MNNSAEATWADEAERLRRRERDIGEYVREEPLTALAIASGVGFVLGGGASSRLGLSLLTIVGRIALRGAASNFLVDLFAGRPAGQRRNRARTRSESNRYGNL